MGLFGGKKQEAFVGMLGVDIGPSGIKIVELVPEKARLRLSTYGYAEFAAVKPEGFDYLSDPQKAAETMQQIMKEAGMKATKAVAALPTAQVFQAIVSIPRPDDVKDLKGLIETQAAKLLPLPIEQMIVDSNVLDKDLLPKATGEKEKQDAPVSEEPKKAKHVRVLITAAPKTLVEKYIDIFRRAKIELVSLETEVFGLIRALIGKDKSRVMLVDIGLTQTNIAIVDKGTPFLTRSMKGGGAQITQALASSMSMGLDDAERMKRDLGLQKDAQEPPKVIKDALAGLVHELKYAIELYAQQDFHENSSVEKIVVTGGSAHLSALDPYLTKELNVNVYIGDPWARVAAPPALRPVLEDVGPRFAVAIGLAMRLKEDV